MIEVTDAIDRQIRLERPAERVVSLVPSETLSVAEVAGVDRVVGRTDYCVEPMGRLEGIPSVGGTKGFDVEAVISLRPDLVLANKEENSRPLVQALIAAGVPTHVSFPCTVEESVQYLETLCVLLGIDASSCSSVRVCRAALESSGAASEREPLPVFVPIWKDPWMTFGAGAYASDVLRCCGAQNVFAGRERKYPLAADLGKTEARTGAAIEERDTRYPRIRIEEVLERGAAAVLLPDEPYAFAEEDITWFERLDANHALAAAQVDGKELFWYGAYAAHALGSLTRQIDRLRARCFGT